MKAADIIAKATEQLLASHGAGCAMVMVVPDDPDTYEDEPPEIKKVVADVKLRGYDAWIHVEWDDMYGWIPMTTHYVCVALPGRREAVDAFGRFARKFGGK
jgi:hypothetical protein